MAEQTQAPEATPPPRRRRRLWLVTGGAIAVLLVAIVATVAYLLSSSGLPFLVARIVAQTGGRLSVEGVEGSAVSTMRFKRLLWRGTDATVEATDVVVDWDPAALWSREVLVRGLGAQRVSIAIKPSSGATKPPDNLALPLEVTIQRLDVAELLWQAGPRSGRITGLEFGYHGSASEHRIDGVRLVSDYGSLQGQARLGAIAPLPLHGGFAIVGDGPLAGARIDTTLAGTLGRLEVQASGSFRDNRLAARVIATPFAGFPLEQADLSLQDVDVASLVEALPHSRANLSLTLAPQGGALVGNIELTNASPGPIDAQRWPIAQARAHYELRGERLALSDLDATLAGNGRARGSGTLEIGAAGMPSRWSLDVRDVDLAQIHTRLLRTRIAGSIVASVDRERQALQVDVRDDRIALRGDATIERSRIVVSRLQASAAGGSANGSGEISLEGNRAFRADVTLAQFDPSRFGSFPQGTLAGHLTAAGQLQPAWRVSANAQIAQGSQIKGLPIAAQASATVAPGLVVHDANLEGTVGSTHVVAHGSAGSVGDALQFTLEAQRLADMQAWLPASVPHPFDGAVTASGTLRIEPGGIGADVDAHATALRIGEGYRVERLDVVAQFAPGGGAAHPAALDARGAHLTVQAQGTHLAQRSLASARIVLDGTLAKHVVDIAVKDDDIDVTTQLAGGFVDIVKSERTWTGTVQALDNRGDIAVHLVSPAQLSVSGARQRLSSATFTIAEGRVTIEELRRDASRITTRGNFTGVPLASAARLAGHPLPIASTLVFGGAWSIAAAPRLSGEFGVRREAGDLYAAQVDENGVASLPFGISNLFVAGTLLDDALDARATFASARAGDAEGTFHIDSVLGSAQGTIPRSAPLHASLVANLASLQVLQPWIGTTAAINGRAHLDVSARGTFGDPVISGTLEGNDIAIDAVPYGLHVTDGQLRARVAQNAIVIDSLSFLGGDGRFTAQGTLAAGRGAKPGTSRVTWKSEKFRVLNRPNLRVVVNGEGSITLEEKHVVLAGTVSIDEGHVEYEPQHPGRLSDDVVIKGRPPAEPHKSGFGDLPLVLDVEVDFGRNFSFTGEGLDTRLGGRVKVTTASDGTLRGRGTIRAVNGTFSAFGQRLTIEQGRMIFDGPLDNPALDVVALRKNLPVEAGIRLAGTVKLPLVQITSNPPVPENEALAWLLTGQPLSSTGRNDYAALSAASSLLLSRKGGKPLTTEIAQALGLDEISVQPSMRAPTAATGTSGVGSQVVVLGKRINNRLTLGYEQGVGLSSAALRLEYTLTRTVTLRLEAGPVSGAGVVYRRSFR